MEGLRTIYVELEAEFNKGNGASPLVIRTKARELRNEVNAIMEKYEKRGELKRILIQLRRATAALESSGNNLFNDWKKARSQLKAIHDFILVGSQLLKQRWEFESTLFNR